MEEQVKIVNQDIIKSYGPFAIEKGETAKKIFFELIVILDIF